MRAPGKPKPLPKTEAAVREVPLRPELLPMLRRMREGARIDDYALPILWTRNDKFRAKLLREHLRLAGVTRARLFADTATLRPVDFRSLRDSGITCEALAGTPLQVIKARAGHENIETTLGYVKVAEDLSGEIGAPFPPLPSRLLNRPQSSGTIKCPQLRPFLVPEEGIEPPT